MKKSFSLLLALVLCFTLVSCGGDSVKVPDWLIGTWECDSSSEKAVFTKDNFVMYNKWDREEANISNLIAEAKEEGYKVGISNNSNSKGYTLSVINKETKRKQSFLFEKKSEQEFSFMGYTFKKK